MNTERVALSCDSSHSLCIKRPFRRIRYSCLSALPSQWTRASLWIGLLWETSTPDCATAGELYFNAVSCKIVFSLVPRADGALSKYWQSDGGLTNLV